MKHKNILWRDRKRNWLGLPWTFTVYQLDESRLFIDTGFFNSVEDDVRLYRITDITLHRSLWQKIIGTGTIHCDSADQTQKEFDIKNVKKAFDVKELLSDLVETARRENRVYTREDMRSGWHGEPDFDHHPVGPPPDGYDVTDGFFDHEINNGQDGY